MGRTDFDEPVKAPSPVKKGGKTGKKEIGFFQAETLENDGALLFNDEFDDTTETVESKDVLILEEPLVDAPLFEDEFEDGNIHSEGALFADDEFNEEKTAQAANEELKASTPTQKGKKGKKGKK